MHRRFLKFHFKPMDLDPLVANVARSTAQKIYGPRGATLGKATVVFYTQSETEILIREAIHMELKKLGLVK